MSPLKVLLVYPKSPDTFWSFRHVMPLLGKKAAFPPLGLLTVAAMLPASWSLRVVDMNVRDLTDADLSWAGYVMISAMIIHRESVHMVADRCRSAGKPLVAGGPLFTTASAEFPGIRHFVLGEAEHIMAELTADMESGHVKAAYHCSNRPALALCPIPRWDLINLNDYVTMSVQFSRGCPFNCEFCDIIIMNGRVPRTKDAGQLIAELESLRRRGWKDSVFIVDDNFIGNKNRSKELLRAIIEWRARTGARMTFLTEASVNLADDAELCRLMAQAGFQKVFLGLETPSPASLAECHKIQNTGKNLVAAVKTIQRAGMEVLGGFIVGFDSDTKDIFRQQFRFVQRSGVVVAMVGLLNALPGTQLHQRLLREGRMEGGTSGNNTRAELNFQTKLDRTFLVTGYRRLMRRLYEPTHYYARIDTFLRAFRPRSPGGMPSRAELLAFVRGIWLLGFRERGRVLYWRLFWRNLLFRPSHFPRAMELAVMGHHFRKVAEDL